MYIYIFSLSFISGHWTFHIWATINNAVINMGVHMSIQESDFISFRYILKKVMDQMIVLFLFFWGTSTLFSIMAVPTYILTSVYKDTLLSTSSSSTLVIFLLFDNNHWGVPSGSVGNESSCNAGDIGDTGSIPGSGRSPGEGNGNPL